MADYYSILRKTIDGLQKNTPEIRQAVYRKARTAIEKQLRGMSPPPSDEAIQSQLQLLEESILVVDSEYTLAAPMAETAVAPPAPPAMPEPAPQQTPPMDPTPAAVPPAPSDFSAASPAVSADLNANSAAAAPDAAPAPTVSNISPEPVTASVAPVAAPSPEPVPVAPTAPVPEPPTVNQVPPAPSLEPMGQAPELAASEPMSGSRSTASPYGEPKNSSGGFGKVLAVLLTLGLIGGAGYAIWLNKDALGTMISSFTGSGSDTSTAEPEDTVSADDSLIDSDTAAQVDKEPIKLGADGQDTSVEPATEPETQPVQTTEQPLITENEDEASADPTGEPVVEPVQEVQDGTVADNQQTLPIGEVAYLYEEGGAGAGATRTNAAVAWTTRNESLAEGLAPEPVIIGNMEVPEKNLSMGIEIKRNVDEALSASHIIELRFNVPEGFSGNGIDNIARFVMKASEEARGEPLVAVPVKVSDGYFLIALDNLQQAVDVNTQLLLDSAWIDIPVSYATGKRALVTLEKGGTGERVFQDAFKDWQNR